MSSIPHTVIFLTKDGMYPSALISRGHRFQNYNPTHYDTSVVLARPKKQISEMMPVFALLSLSCDNLSLIHLVDTGGHKTDLRRERNSGAK